jgi:hypothetical protein
MPFIPRLSTCAAFAALVSLSALGHAVTNTSLASVHENPAPTSGTPALREGSGRAIALAREGRALRSRLLVLNDCPGASDSIL